VLEADFHPIVADFGERDEALFERDLVESGSPEADLVCQGLSSFLRCGANPHRR